MIAFNKKRPKNIMNTENTSHTLPKGLYGLNLMPPPPYSLILSPKNTFLVIFAILLAFYGQAQDDTKPFITTWQITSDNRTITIPTTGSGYSYSVKWGDRMEDNNTYTGNASHTYSQPGTYTITISGTFPRIFFRKNFTAAGQIRSIEKWGDNPWTSMDGAFRNCSNLSIDEEAGIPNLSGVTDMFGMFQSATFTGDLSKWDVSKVTNMAAMFQNSSFNQDLSKWDVRKVTNMTAMFQNSSFNQDLSEWDVSNVTDMEGMFSGSSMSSENYDKLLIGWSTLDEAADETRIPSGITFGAPDKYSCRGKAGRD
ncbi:MAG: BspA family leucine-rich repeat surface protein, partial [Ekhidna sp.]|nr:BspA family leucine-rich repeat surface protein [Ekhidna sp.]